MFRSIAVLAVISSLAMATAAGAQTVPEKAIDPVRLDLARQVFVASGGAESVERQLKAVFAGAATMVKGNAPGASPKLTEALANDIVAEEVKLIPQLLDESAKAYAENLTEQELRDMLAWTKSDSARSIRQKMPAITQELMTKVMPAVLGMMPTIMQKSVDRVCEETHCTPEVKATLKTNMGAALKSPKS